MIYNPWPCGKLLAKQQRQELNTLKAVGYDFDDPREAVNIFERKIAEFAGSKYAVAVDSCTDALFLALKYRNAQGEILIPARTYCSVPMSVIHAGCCPIFHDMEWSGIYDLLYPLQSEGPQLAVIDGAGRFREGMYVPGTLHCLSFQIKKRLPIGKGGMILTDDPDAYKWLKVASFEGRHLDVPYDKDRFSMAGWNMYMTPEDAARGIILFDQLIANKEQCWDDVVGSDSFTDLSKQKIFSGKD
jgi:dTDP-4-amino-4,6-dideoxygalactose transaminase